MTDDVQLTALFSRMCQAWADGDAQAYGACFTPDADYVSFDGARAIGRDPMVQAHDKLFRGVLTGSSLVGKVESIRYLGPDVALVHATGSVLVPGAPGYRSGGCPGRPWSRSAPRRAGGSPHCRTPG